jgi:hypothetical protein
VAVLMVAEKAAPMIMDEIQGEVPTTARRCVIECARRRSSFEHAHGRTV